MPTIERLFPSAGYVVTDTVEGHVISRSYYFYTKRDALRLFRREFPARRGSFGWYRIYANPDRTTRLR